MNEKQKKIIRNTFIVILGIITTFGFVCFIISTIPSLKNIDFIKNYAEYIKYIGLFFPTFFGSLCKFILSKYHEKVIKDTINKADISNENKQEIITIIESKKPMIKPNKNKSKTKKELDKKEEKPKSYGYC